MQKASQDKQADAELVNNQKMIDGEVGAVQQNEGELEAKAAQLNTNMQVAMNEIQTQTFLPRLTASQANRDAETKVQGIKSQINKLSGTSLLETKEQNTAGQASAQQAEQERAEQEEEQAVLQLNQELEKENAKLQRENANLESGLKRLKL